MTILLRIGEIWNKKLSWAEHLEWWELFRDVPTPKTEGDIDRIILPLVDKA